MKKSIDLATATIEELHAGVHAIGTDKQKQRADEILYGFSNVGTGLNESRELHRNAMMSLLATVEWEHSFSDEAEEERRENFRRNFGRAEG